MRALSLGGCKVKFTWICLSAIGAGGQAWTSKTCNVLGNFPYSVSSKNPPWLGQEKKNLK